MDAISGNERARGFLRRAMADGRVSHAYLFSGPAGVGKTATALAFAADLLEASGSATVTAAHPDLWVEDGDAEILGIDTIRMSPRRGESRSGRGGVGGEDDATAGEADRSSGQSAVVAGGDLVAGQGLGFRPPPQQSLQAFLALKGLHSDRRVAVLARAERLRETAAAPLLKTIEEPPEGAVLIVCTESTELLPATIRSRCQEVDFQPLDEATMAAFLSARGVTLPAIAVRLAGGCPGRALRLAADDRGVERRMDWVDALRAVRGRGWLAVVGLGTRFGGQDSRANRALAKEAMEVWETELRDLTVALAGAPELGRLPAGAGGAGGATRDGGTGGAGGAATGDGGAATALAAPAEAAWRGVGVDEAVGLWRAARETADRIHNNVNPRLAIEVFLADVARGRSDLVEALGSEYLPAAPARR